MKKNDEVVFVVYKQTDLGTFELLRAYKDLKKAEVFCKKQNDLNLPEFDDYGYVSGIYHNYYEMEVWE